MAWYDDEDLWVDFACVLFPERREREAAELVATSPLLKAGFREVECFGGFDASPYDNHARRLIVRGVRA